jgi:DNA-binding winged helix-turn-helix (wHTH) protein
MLLRSALTLRYARVMSVFTLLCFVWVRTAVADRTLLQMIYTACVCLHVCVYN